MNLNVSFCNKKLIFDTLFKTTHDFEYKNFHENSKKNSIFSNSKIQHLLVWVIELIGSCGNFEVQTFPYFVSSYKVFSTLSHLNTFYLNNKFKIILFSP